MDPSTVPMPSMENQLLNYQLGGFDGRWKLGAAGSGGGTEVAPSCPRCASQNTKFCYYNNYSLSQPRYFCKSCRRYWTRGGSLRNIPVGGGCRKSRRSRAARAAKADSSPLTPPNSNSNSPSTDDNLKSDAPEIDLATVFAKFLNPSSGPEPQLDPLNCIDGESSSEVVPGYVIDPLMFLPQGSAAEMQPVHGDGEFFMGNDLGALGLVQANVLAEGDFNQPMPVDGLWLDHEPTMVDFSWQQEASPSDDSWMISSVADSWSSTPDCSGFEILSRP